MQYRRAKAAGGIYFFTVNLADRRSDLLVQYIDHLRDAVRGVRQRHPFEIVAMVVLPEHLHAIWMLPDGDMDYPLRWALIKSTFSRALPKNEVIRDGRSKRRERGIWQRRYWEHQIRNDVDLARHVDYIHFNPVKHGHVAQAVDWPYSSIHRFVRLGLLTPDWGSGQSMIDGELGEPVFRRLG
ncbi:REP-associated tyrosine transposase [Andreprevotia chitinilytica]|uniref:REP-associated tyrosine transposase n=1 Tax=Andreprevotia chitinilytica TaxID=396808 RepID=UPI0005584BA1|nr:transposase [Andreprevotia chitinilytica]